MNIFRRLFDCTPKFPEPIEMPLAETFPPAPEPFQAAPHEPLVEFMPDKERGAKTKQWLIKKWKKTPKCEMCNHQKWVVTECLYSLPVFQDKVATMPLVAVTCDKCGNTKLISAMLAKLFIAE